MALLYLNPVPVNIQSDRHVFGGYFCSWIVAILCDDPYYLGAKIYGTEPSCWEDWLKNLNNLHDHGF
jgi:hypothetical protein